MIKEPTKLRRFREATGHTDEYVALTTGIELPVYQQIEVGRRMPTLEQAIEIADALKTHAYALFERYSSGRPRRTIEPLHKYDEPVPVQPWMHPQPENLVVLEELRRLEDAALRKLTPRQQQVIRLRYYHDLSTAKTAKTLGISAGRVNQLEHEAMKKLRRPSIIHTFIPYARSAYDIFFVS